MIRRLLLPLQALAVATTAKSFRDNPVIGSPRLNRWGLHVLRRRAAAAVATWRRARLAALVPAEDREAFLRDGYLVKPNFLPQAQFEALRAEILAHRAPCREFIDGSTMTRQLPLDPAALRDLPVAREALLSSRYLGLHAFIGAYRRRPYLFVQSVFSGVRDAPPDVQSHFHADTFHATVKSWLLLTPVAPGEAGFTYIPGSHRPSRRREAWERHVSLTAHAHQDRLTGEGSLRISEADLHRLGYAPPLKIAAAPNTLIIADTSGFHRRGLSDGFACRISIWAYSRSNPFIPWWSGDPLPGPLHGMAARLLGHARRLLGMRARSGWREATEASPADPHRLPEA